MERRQNMAEHMKTASQGTLETGKLRGDRRNWPAQTAAEKSAFSLVLVEPVHCIDGTVGGGRKKQSRQLSNDNLLKIRK